MSLVIVDSGGANLASVANAFRRLGAEPTVSSDADAIRQASRVVLPGVGAAGASIRQLRRLGLDSVIADLRQPVLGICLGMQLLYAGSDEAPDAALDILPGGVSRLKGNVDLSVPHMGWNRLHDIKPHPVLERVDTDDWFYFAHSYAAPVNAATLAQGEYGETFAAAAGTRNFFAVQFHPEKSAAAGARLLQRFLEWNGCN